MKSLKDKKILLTGATGGLGYELAKLLSKQQCKLILVGRNKEKLTVIAEQLQRADGCECVTLASDITTESGRSDILDFLQQKSQGLDIIINNAAIMEFSKLENTQIKTEAVFQTNVIAPIELCKMIIPLLQQSNDPHIVNIGSTFGSIAFPGFSCYSASKFALRGFSESLRRELAPKKIKVSYIAPRAIKTSLNDNKVYQFAEKTNMHMDEPATVAAKIIKAIQTNKSETFIGFPESLFVRINAIFPNIVNSALKSKVKIMESVIG